MLLRWNLYHSWNWIILISATSDAIRNVIASCPNKSCQLDPIPTWLVKQCVDQVLPFLTSIINESLTKGEFPNDFKNAIVNPLLKKPILDKDELKNYRPVSNLHFISKIIEKLAWVSTRCTIQCNQHTSWFTQQKQPLWKLTATYLAALMPESVLFLYPLTFPQPSILLITTYSWTDYNICMGSPALPLKVPVVHWTEKQLGLCWRLRFTKTASNIRRTTGVSVGCQTVYHVHLPSSINFQQTQGGVS